MRPVVRSLAVRRQARIGHDRDAVRGRRLALVPQNIRSPEIAAIGFYSQPRNAELSRHNRAASVASRAELRRTVAVLSRSGGIARLRVYAAASPRPFVGERRVTRFARLRPTPLRSGHCPNARATPQ